MRGFFDRFFSVKTLLRRQTNSVSRDYQIITPSASLGDISGWHNSYVALRQDAAYQRLIQRMYIGKPRQDFTVAAAAVRATGLPDPSVLEVGCGSGYYSEILAHLLDRPVRYSGLDFSRAMVNVASRHYPSSLWVNGDATRLPFGDDTYDIVLNGVSLMHILDYPTAIVESRRVARHWCIFHTVPVLQKRTTTILRKQAYQGETVEIIFNEAELLSLLRQAGLAVRSTLDSIPYDLQSVLSEPTATRTYVCEVRP